MNAIDRLNIVIEHLDEVEREMRDISDYTVSLSRSKTCQEEADSIFSLRELVYEQLTKLTDWY